MILYFVSQYKHSTENVVWVDVRVDSRCRRR